MEVGAGARGAEGTKLVVKEGGKGGWWWYKAGRERLRCGDEGEAGYDVGCMSTAGQQREEQRWRRVGAAVIGRADSPSFCK